MNYSRFFLLTVLSISALLFTNCNKNDDPKPGLNAPLALNASDIDKTSFTANWTGVSAAESYLLDVSRDGEFTSFIDGYQGKSISSNSEHITGLEPVTQYFYRVRAVKGSSESANSNVVKLTTLLPDNISLKDAAETFYVGMIVQSNRMTGTHDEIIRREFSSLTSEYEMKMNITYPAQGTYNWVPADAIVNYANLNGINMHGHALIWHNSVPDWVRDFSGTDLEFENMIKDYVKTTVTRYKGKVKSWDVVNEAFDDGTGTLRNTIFKQKMGDDYIAKCFGWAREADPDVLLFYNDYNMCNDVTKQDAVFAMVDDLKTRGISIDGIGYQMHISYNWPTKEEIIAATNKIVDRQLLVHYSELDIRANPNNDLTSLSSARSLEQKTKYNEVVKIYSAIPTSNKYALTIWGLKDNESWLISQWGHADWPLLYDSNFNEKDAYYGVLEGLLVN